MNVILNKKRFSGGLLINKFNVLKNKAGVYIISPLSNPTDKKLKIKIGISSNLYNRLDQYHTYYPDSFYTFACIITRNYESAKKLETHILDYLRNYQYKNEYYEARLKGEWLYIWRNKLINGLNEMIKLHNDGVISIFNFQPRHFKLTYPEEYMKNDRTKESYYI